MRQRRVGQRGSAGMGGLPPGKAIIRAVDQNDRLNTSNPIDEESFEDNSNNMAVPQPGRVNPNAGAIAAGGANPNQNAPSQQARTLSGSNLMRRGPGIVHKESVVRKEHTGEGHVKNFALNRPNSSRRGPGLLPHGPNVVRAKERGAGIKNSVSPNNTQRWQRKGSANPGFYGDWGL